VLATGYYSFGRGGTGKTTLAIASTVLASLAEWRVLLVDVGDPNNSSAMRLLSTLEPPFTGDVLARVCDWGDAVVEVRLDLKDGEARFYMMPSSGHLPQNPDLSAFYRMLEELEGMDAVDLVIFDLPTDPLGTFLPLLSKLDRVAVVAVPEYATVRAVLSRRLPAYVIPVLNKYRPEARPYLAALQSFFGSCYPVGYDEALEDLNPSNIKEKLSSLSSDTRRQLVRLVNGILAGPAEEGEEVVRPPKRKNP